MQNIKRSELFEVVAFYFIKNISFRLHKNRITSKNIILLAYFFNLIYKIKEIKNILLKCTCGVLFAVSLFCLFASSLQSFICILPLINLKSNGNVFFLSFKSSFRLKTFILVNVLAELRL